MLERTDFHITTGLHGCYLPVVDVQVPIINFCDHFMNITSIFMSLKRKKKCPKGILPSGKPLHTITGDGGWIGKLAPGLVG
jgi:hypothetical protein